MGGELKPNELGTPSNIEFQQLVKAEVTRQMLLIAREARDRSGNEDKAEPYLAHKVERIEKHEFVPLKEQDERGSPEIPPPKIIQQSLPKPFLRVEKAEKFLQYLEDTGICFRSETTGDETRVHIDSRNYHRKATQECLQPHYRRQKTGIFAPRAASNN